MFIVLITYLKRLDEVETHLAAHRVFLSKHYANGNFLLSGRKQPRTGGVILVKPMPPAALESIICEDPFHQAGVAAYEVIEFTPTMAAPQFSALTTA